MRKLILLGALACVALVVVGVSAGSNSPRAYATGPTVKLDNNGVKVTGFECVAFPSAGGGPIFTEDTAAHLYLNENRDQMRCTFHYGSGSLPDTPYTDRIDSGDCVYSDDVTTFFFVNRLHVGPKKAVLTCKHGGA